MPKILQKNLPLNFLAKIINIFLIVFLLLSTLTLFFVSTPKDVYAAECTITPSSLTVTPEETMSITVTNAAPGDLTLRLIQVLGGNVIDIHVVSINESGTGTITVTAPAVLGSYVYVPADETRCPNTVSPGFNVANPTTGGLTFVTTPDQVTSQEKKISIRINGLEPDKCYVVKKVAGFTGTYASQQGGSLCDLNLNSSVFNPNDLLLSDSDGSLRVTGICENMEGIRNDCTDPFDAGVTYSFQVLKVRSSGFSINLDEVGDAMSFTVTEGRTTIISDTPGVPFLDTPFGPIRTDPAGFASDIVGLAVGIAGGIAFLMLVYGGFKFIFSSGNPEAVQQGREIITAAIIGLIVIVFSVFILRLIGISILGLPI